MFRQIKLLAVATLLLAAAGTAYGQGGTAYAQIDPGSGAVQGYYSPRLQGNFQIRNFYLPAYGNFRAVRITSLDYNSPLREIGLRAGDVITRLDGVQIHNLGELERHAYDTTVRYIKAGAQNVQTSEVYLPYSDNGSSSNYPPSGETP